MATEDDVSALPEFFADVADGTNLCDRFQVVSGNGKQRSSFSVTPVIVDFNRLLQQQTLNRVAFNESVISGITNNDLLHAVVGLYDVCLSELTPDILYSTVCDRWARTIVLVRDVKDVFLEFEKQRDRKDKKKKVADIADVEGNEKDVYQFPEPAISTFSCCYSDSSSESEEDSDSDEEEDYSKGINKYRSQASQRRKKRQEHTGPFTLDHVGPENRIVAAVTFDKKYIKKGGEKIVHLTLLAIRRKFRRRGLGKYLITQVKDPVISGSHDAVVVHAESEAASFFVRYGFSDDLLLNSKWREIAEQFTNCTLLTYIPPYTGQSMYNRVSSFDLLSLDNDLRSWKERSVEAYQSQMTIIERMKAEMIRLRSMITTQDDTIRDLKSKLTIMEASKVQTEKELLVHKMKYINFNNTNDGDDDTLDGVTSSKSLQDRYQVVSSRLPEGDGPSGSQPSTLVAASDASSLLAGDVEQELRRYVVVADSSEEIYDHGKDIAQFHRICEDFQSSLKKDVKAEKEYNVTSVSKALLTTSVISKYASIMRSIGGKSTVMKLYYCGSYDHPESLEHILKDGFSEQEVVDGDYGRGIYFSRYASTALHFTPPNKVLVAEVIVGKCQTLVTEDKGRQSPDAGYNSILCPGRLATANCDGSLVQEYIIFDWHQALPLDLIEYSTHTDNHKSDKETEKHNNKVDSAS